jgi:hypothetical protein
MIKLNFIPEYARKRGGGFLEEGVGGVAAESILGGVIAFFGLIVLGHVLLAGMTLYKMANYKMIEARWSAMGADKKAYDEITGELGKLQAKMNSLRPITSAGQVPWARLLNDVSDSVPKGVWLREILFENGTLAVYGSSVSKMSNEMVEAGNFVAALKKTYTIKEHFLGMDIDSIQRRQNMAVAVADFSLKAKYKK